MEIANDNRPKSFDAQLEAHMPFLRYLAKDREDVVQDIALAAMQKWQRYSGDYKFSTRLGLVARAVADDARVKRTAKKREARFVGMDAVRASVAPTQQDYAELSSVIRRLSGTRDSDVLMRYAMGEDLAVIGADYGIGKERARQLCERERARLRVAAR
ncbi:sigma-70 family RNA polymerase sigma factor [Ensifer sp. ENS04]|uniref:sigma-70 family RNA polymerase sigma factor n=1 Tax=Ensifer sp. ENS04 TaxID=2769281 RepID=UPI001784563A|nr:sigma-70 family RNA polymerase sigma factor [Ensifer sp. ENS04]MBD9542920.1 sigma-70 family RNA polymerase sigma factor [Ensifer sp. ENS04]